MEVPLDEMGPPHKRPPDEMEPQVQPPSKRTKCSDFCSNCKGVRVFYYKEGMSNTNDHSNEHISTWKEEVTKIIEEQRQTCLEAGVVVNCWQAVATNSGSDLHVEVMWDCGVSKTYSNAAGEWDNIRILDMGPAGYRAPCVICDICKTPLTGFSFRCTDVACSVDENEVFDLCYKDYNEGYHLDGTCKDHQMQCIMQNIFNLDRQRNKLPLRNDSVKFRLVGLFAGARVTKTQDGSKTGTLQKVVHKGGVSGFMKAGLVDVWNCTAEVSYEGVKELVYEDIGNKGKVEIFALTPGDGKTIYADHFPRIGFEECYILKEISKFIQSTDIQKHDFGGYCYRSQESSALTICNASLENIDPKIFDPTSGYKFRSVDLMHNKLTTIPNEVSHHKDSIVNVGLSFNHFKFIPLVLFDFKRLIHLNVVQNQLSCIPKEIGNFCNLKVLFLDNNRIRMLPDQLGKLKNLKILGLGWNILTSLPTTMKNLCSLHRLELHHNQFKVFPSVLCSSELQLDTLTMNNNRIQVVPECAKNLISSLTHFTIHNNPIQKKDSLTFSNANALFTELIMSHDNKSKPRGTLRALVLGMCGSGKTSLTKAVVNSDYITPIDKEEIDHTVGIDLYSHRFSLEDNIYEISLWDFAGEKCYAMMNQMFLTNGSLVWLVFNMHKYKIGNKDCFENNIGTWLRGVVARIKNPVVWIIGTHADECGSMAEQVKANVEKFLRHIFKDIPDIPVLAVSNAHDLRGHCELNKKIMELPTHQAFSASFGELKPHWSTSEECLLNLASQKMNKPEPPIVSKAQAFECLKTQGLIEDEKDFKKFIKKLHKGGEIFIFKESVCLDVVWLISLLREIFRSDLADQLEINLTNLEIHEASASIRKKGTISRRTLLKIWKGLGITEECFNKIVELFSEFKLAFESKSKCFLFPWLLSTKGDDKITFSNICQKLRSCDHSIMMNHSFNFLPATFFQQFIAICSKQVQISEVTISLMSGDFERLKVYAIKIPDKDSVKGHIFCAICADNDSDPNYSEMWHILEWLSDTLHHIAHEDWKGNEQPYSYVVCPQCVHFKESNPKLLLEYDQCKTSKTENPPQAEDGW